MGYGTAVTVKEGIYFINGTVVKNDTQTIILEKYNNTPTYKVGFIVSEQLTTPEKIFHFLITHRDILTSLLLEHIDSRLDLH